MAAPAGGGDRTSKLLGRRALDAVGACTGLDHGRCHLVLVVGGESDDARFGYELANASGRGEPVQHGHPHVHEDDVRSELNGQRDRLIAVSGFSDDLDLGLAFEDRAERAPEGRRVVDDESPDHWPR